MASALEAIKSALLNRACERCEQADIEKNPQIVRWQAITPLGFVLSCTLLRC
jgi:hypothetical protein